MRQHLCESFIEVVSGHTKNNLEKLYFSILPYRKVIWKPTKHTETLHQEITQAKILSLLKEVFGLEGLLSYFQASLTVSMF